jgi:hypothetical protein
MPEDEMAAAASGLMCAGRREPIIVVVEPTHPGKINIKDV